MHELSLVAALIDECRLRAGGRAVENVRVRLGATLRVEELHEVFAMLAANTNLAGAVLEVEMRQVEVECVCGYSGPVGDDDLVGQVVVCQRCGRMYPSAANGLELLAVSLGQ